jgi:hypothetical protein
MRRAALLSLCLLLPVPAMAGSVSGQATGEDGKPMAGVKVEIVYQTYNADRLMGHGASIKAEARTGADGRYDVDISRLPPGEYSAHAWVVIDNGGKPTNIDLVPDDPATFPGTDRTVRNFAGGYVEQSERLPYGNGCIFVLNNTIGDFTDLSNAEVRLENLATARVIEKKVRRTGEGLVVTGVPFGTYRASVSLAGQPLKVALSGVYSDVTFTDFIVHDFTMGWLRNQFQVQARP